MKRRDWAILALLAGVSVLQSLPVLRSADAWGFWDWDITAAGLEAARVTVIEYDQVPGWYPYLRGGERLDAHPILPLASPAFLAVLLLGTMPGIKLWLLLRQFAALWGAYLLARRLHLSRLAALATSAGFGLASMLALRAAHGHWNLHASAYLPLLLYAGLGAIETGTWRARAAAALWLALLFLEGGPYAYTCGLLGIAGLCCIGVVRRRVRMTLIATGCIVVLSLALSSVKLLPVMEVYGGGARDLPYGEGEMLDFYNPWFTPSMNEYLHAALLDRVQEHRPERFMTFRVNVGAYIGWFGIGLALIGGAAGGAVGRGALLFALAGLWLCLGSTAPVNLWAGLHTLPGFRSMSIPSKFTPCYLLALAVAAGAGMDAFLRLRTAPRWLASAAAAALLAWSADMILVSRPLMAQAFPLEPLQVTRGRFHQKADNPYAEALSAALPFEHSSRPYTSGHSMTADLPAVLANHGVLNGVLNQIPHPVSAVADANGAAPGAIQRSKVEGRPPERSYWSPNHIVFEVDPERAGTLVLNQNFEANWRARSGGQDLRVFARKGRQAAKLLKNQTSVSFYYESRLFSWGAWVSGTALLLCLTLLIRRPRTEHAAPSNRRVRGWASRVFSRAERARDRA